MSAQTSRSETRPRVVRSYWRRRELPLGWWPWGLLPLAGLLLLFLWGLFRIAPDIERTTRAGVESALTDAGFPGLAVVADGQRVIVRGAIPDGQTARVRGVARGATCDAFVARNLVCPTNVVVESAPATPPDDQGRAHNFTFLRRTAGVVLRGEVPDGDTRAQLVAEAQSRYTNVVDSLIVTGDEPASSFAWATDKAWSILDRVTVGGVRWTNGVVSAWGRTTRDGAERIRATFGSSAFPSRIGRLELQVAEDVDRCNEAFSSVLRTATINFRTGSAEISTDSQGLLQLLAEVAQDCPGQLDVEGHTDNVGDAALNRDLSQRRAQAVVDALSALGVESGRFRARGFGEDRPMAGNGTSEGRARNRRIEIKVAAFE